MLLEAEDHLLYICLILGRVCNTSAHFLSLSILFSLACLPATPLLLTKEVGNGGTSLWHTVRLVLLCPAIFSPLMYFITPPHGPLSSHSFFIPLIFVLSHTSNPALFNGTLHTPFQILFIISLCFLLRTQLLAQVGALKFFILGTRTRSY